MNSAIAFLFFVLFAVPAAALAQVTAFVGVNVIPIDRERVLDNQTVIVRQGIITAIGRYRNTSSRPKKPKVLSKPQKFLKMKKRKY